MSTFQQKNISATFAERATERNTFSTATNERILRRVSREHNFLIDRHNQSKHFRTNIQMHIRKLFEGLLHQKQADRTRK